MENQESYDVLNKIELVGSKKLTSKNKELIPHLEKLKLNDNLLQYEKNRISNIDNSFKNIVSYQKIDSCILPIDIKKILGEKLYNNTNILLQKMIDINNKYVGQIVSSALISLNNNKEHLSIRYEMLELGKEYCAKRIIKTNNRDKDEVERYFRIYREILPWLDQNVSERENTIFSSFLDLLLEYIPHFLYEQTFNKYVEIKNRDQLIIKDAISSQKKQLIKEQFYFYNFHQNHLEELLKFTTSIQFPSNIDSLSKDGLLKKVFDLAQDIKWWGTFMCSSYKNFDNLISIIQGELDVSWSWNSDNSIGFISFWFDNKELVKQLKKRRILQVSLNYEGVFEDGVRRWVSLLNIYDTNNNLSGLKINLFIIEKIHSYLDSIYCKIDVNKILNQYLGKINNDDLIVEDKEKIIFTDNNTPKIDKNEIFKIKQSRLFNHLESIGCEIRGGKGSEITIYKFGGKHYTMGHHKRDEYVYSPTIINILKTLNISLEDFALSISRD